jgi:hypothetical protein
MNSYDRQLFQWWILSEYCKNGELKQEFNTASFPDFDSYERHMDNLAKWYCVDFTMFWMNFDEYEEIRESEYG